MADEKEYFEDENGKWEIVSEFSRILIEPSEKYLTERNKPKTAEEQKQDILLQLLELDYICSREREAIWETGQINIFMTQSQLDAIAKKNELRLQLKELSDNVANSDN